MDGSAEPRAGNMQVDRKDILHVASRGLGPDAMWLCRTAGCNDDQLGGGILVQKAMVDIRGIRMSQASSKSARGHNEEHLPCGPGRKQVRWKGSVKFLCTVSLIAVATSN